MLTTGTGGKALWGGVGSRANWIGTPILLLTSSVTLDTPLNLPETSLGNVGEF